MHYVLKKHFIKKRPKHFKKKKSGGKQSERKIKGYVWLRLNFSFSKMMEKFWNNDKTGSVVHHTKDRSEDLEAAVIQDK